MKNLEKIKVEMLKNLGQQKLREDTATGIYKQRTRKPKEQTRMYANATTHIADEKEVFVEENSNLEMPPDTVHHYFSSTDYDKFSLININRPVDMKRVEQIATDINNGNNQLHIYPIIVNQDFEVNDGQHRLEAARITQQRIFYIMDNDFDMEDAARAVSLTKGWTIAHYLHSYAERGFADYMVLRNFWNEYEWLPISVVTALCTTSNYRFASFKNGHYKVDRMNYARKVVKMVSDFKPYIDFYKTKPFIMTLMNLANNSEYDHRQMIRKMEYQPTRLKRHATVESYLETITAIYNHRQPVANHVFFLDMYHRHASKREVNDR